MIETKEINNWLDKDLNEFLSHKFLYETPHFFQEFSVDPNKKFYSFNFWSKQLENLCRALLILHLGGVQTGGSKRNFDPPGRNSTKGISEFRPGGSKFPLCEEFRPAGSKLFLTRPSELSDIKIKIEMTRTVNEIARVLGLLNGVMNVTFSPFNLPSFIWSVPKKPSPSQSMSV